MAVTRSGHSYSDIHISDASRNHLGDNYYQYGPSPEQQAFRAVLDSLRYDGMDDRMERLNSAERGTFEWALGGRDVDSTMDRYDGDEGDGQEDNGDDRGGDEGSGQGSERGSSSDGEDSTDSEGEDAGQEDHGNNEGHTEIHELHSGSDDGERSTGNSDDCWYTDDDEYEDEDNLWNSTKTIDEAFSDWLAMDEEEGDMFCFMGKPGSGKSTLMKYLSTNPKVEQSLQLWTKGKILTQAEHFFWIMGGTVQKSREGLLRHLLYSTMLSLPTDDLDLAKHVCGPKRLSSRSQRAWSYEELYEMLVRLVSRSKAKFFFLVDALDECDPQELHGQLANEMMKISQLPNVKLCVSCRPWSPFVSRFRHDRTLHLDKMTRSDMKLYICNRLANADGENDLCSEFRSAGRTPSAMIFVAVLAGAAEGVFLWTELVVNSLCSELRKGCDFEQLQKARTEFPVGLDEYFQQLVFDRITKTRQNTSDTAAALMLALKIDENWRYEFDQIVPPHSYSFFNFWLLGTGQLTAGFSWANYDEKRHAREDIERMVSLTTKFIHETCKDLLVVVERVNLDHDSRQRWKSWEVEFLHRTVADFLCDDRVRLVIEQQSPDHFQDAGFLIELGRLRCVCLLSVGLQNCWDAERIFAGAIALSLPSRLQNFAWVSKCEALMIDVHQRMQNAGMCCRIHHRNLSWVHEYTRAGLFEYLSALIVLWPCLAICPGYAISSLSLNVLEKFLFGLLTAIFAESHMRIPSKTAKCGVRSSARPWSCVSPSSDEAICSQERFAAHSHYRVVCMSGDRRIGLFQHLLSCGIDPNCQTLEQNLKWTSPIKTCRRSVWQAWLRAVWLELHDQEAEKRKHPTGFGSDLNHVKNNVSDLVAVFLRYGADPTCSVCISRHLDGEACKLVPLESILASTTPQDTLIQLQALRAIHSTRAYWRISRQDHVLRAMRSWTASEQTAYSFDKLANSDVFLSGIVQSIGGFMCDCSVQHEGPHFASALCLDCNCGYYICGPSAKRHFNEIPTRDDVSGLLVHEPLHGPSNDSHIYIWFGLQEIDDKSWEHYGLERSMSVLEDWHAMRTNGEDTALD